MKTYAIPPMNPPRNTNCSKNSNHSPKSLENKFYKNILFFYQNNDEGSKHASILAANTTASKKHEKCEKAKDHDKDLPKNKSWFKRIRIFFKCTLLDYSLSFILL